MTESVANNDRDTVQVAVDRSLSLFREALSLAGWQRTSAGRYQKDGYRLATAYGCGEVRITVTTVDPYEHVVTLVGIDPLTTVRKGNHVKCLKDLAKLCCKALDMVNHKP